MKRAKIAIKVFILPSIVFAGLLWAIVWANGSKEPIRVPAETFTFFNIKDINGVTHVILGKEVGSFSVKWEPEQACSDEEPEKSNLHKMLNNRDFLEYQVMDLKCPKCDKKLFEIHPAFFGVDIACSNKKLDEVHICPLCTHRLFLETKACSSGDIDKCDWACIAHRDKPDPNKFQCDRCKGYAQDFAALTIHFCYNELSGIPELSGVARRPLYELNKKLQREHEEMVRAFGKCDYWACKEHGIYVDYFGRSRSTGYRVLAHELLTKIRQQKGWKNDEQIINKWRLELIRFFNVVSELPDDYYCISETGEITRWSKNKEPIGGIIISFKPPDPNKAPPSN
ncbi:hypothetical protein LCGC14_2008760 [marine sediment metagenome]|uniref:Uncharacterized protein n=1 Tax=marine sediment metagenome TaxID=412755 RepID=A0A0F9F0Y0_9ZZZZ